MAADHPRSQDPRDDPDDPRGAPPDDPHADPHDRDEVQRGRRLVATWYLWPLAILIAVMLIGWFASR